MREDLQYQIQSDNGTIEYEVLLPQTDDDIALLAELADANFQLDEELLKVDTLIDGKTSEIDKYTNQADALCYVVAVSSGLVAGLVDILFVGDFDFETAKQSVDKAFEDFVHNKAKSIKIDKEIEQAKRNCAKKGKILSAKDIAGIKERVSKDFDENPVLSSSIKTVADKYGIPTDNLWKGKDANISSSSHHLDDLAHHPTIFGLAASILTQYTHFSYFQNRKGICFHWEVERMELIGHDTKSRLVCGVINWIGHLISDMAGSESSASRGTLGMGLPGPIVSTIKELGMLPILRKTKLPQIANDLFTKDDALFGKYRMDLRSELALGKELSKQAIPIFINEILVRSFFFLRGMITYAKTANSIEDIPWDKVIPIGNRTIERMMTISVGTMEVIDITDATVRGTIEGVKTGNMYAGIGVFLKTFALRINYVGIGRVVVAGFVDVGMEIKRDKLIKERISLYNDKLKLTNAKLLCKEAEMWVSAEKAGEAILKSYCLMASSQEYYKESCEEINDSLDSIGEHKGAAEQKNPGLTNSMLDTIKWG